MTARKIIVTQAQVMAAMSHFEKEAGGPSGFTLSKEVSKLTDLLCAMWLGKESEAEVPVTSGVGQLLLRALPSLGTDAGDAS
jgi:hypothetical protein